MTSSNNKQNTTGIKFTDYDLHPKLQEGLEANNFKYSSEIQHKSLQNSLFSINPTQNTGILGGQNTWLASESGSGKTLAFLLPIINRILHEKDHSPPPHSTKKKLFLNAEDLYYERKYNSKRLTEQDLINNSSMSGALIITSSRELLNQFYSLIRRLDLDNKISINRVGSSVQLFSPIVEHITMGSDFRNKRELMTKEIDSVSVKNLVNNARWDLHDIMLVTPMVLRFLINDMKKYDPYGMNPSIIAMDEFDLLFTNPGMEDAMLNILRKFGGRKDKLFTQFNKKRQFILSSSTIPKYIQGRQSLHFIKSSFKNLNIIKSSKFNTINSKL